MKFSLKSVLTRLADAGVNFVVAGGVASVLHGVERLTLDLDLALQMDADNMGRFLDVMKDFGLSPRAPVAPETLLDPSVVRRIVEDKHAVVFTFHDPDRPIYHVDIFLTEELSYEELSGDSIRVAVEGREVRLVSIVKLIALKERIDPPRPKDLADLEELRRIQGEEDERT
jgi:predicted nucleotidyltransferase